MPAPYTDDPDPTTQMAWPASHGADAESITSREDQLTQTDRYRAPSATAKPKSPRRNTTKDGGSSQGEDNEIGRARLSTWQLFKLSISMAGAQIAWTVELGCGVLFIRHAYG